MVSFNPTIVNQRQVYTNHARVSYRTVGFVSTTIRTIHSLALTVFYQLADWFCRLIRHSSAERFRLLSHFHWERCSTIEGWWIFGNRRVSQSVNIERKETLIQPIDRAKVNYWFQKANMNTIGYFSFDINRCRSEKKLDGICVGMSLEFVVHYLARVRAGYSTEEAFLGVCQNYLEGGSEDADIVTSMQWANSLTSFSSTSNFQNEHDKTIAQLYDLNVSTITECNVIDPAPYQTLNDGTYLFLMANGVDQAHFACFTKHADKVYFFCPMYGGVIMPHSEFAGKMFRYLKFQNYTYGYLYKVAD